MDHHHHHHHHHGSGGDANRRRKRPRDDSTEVIYEHDYDLMSTKRHASLSARSWLSSSMPSTSSTKRRCPDDPTATNISCTPHTNSLHAHSNSNSHNGHNPSLALPNPPSPPTLYETWGSHYSQTNATLRECHFLRVDRHQRQAHVVFPMSFSLSLTNNSPPPPLDHHHHQHPPLPPPHTQHRSSGDVQLLPSSHPPSPTTSPLESEHVQHQHQPLSPHDDEKVIGNSVPHGSLTTTHLNQSVRTTQERRLPHGF